MKTFNQADLNKEDEIIEMSIKVINYLPKNSLQALNRSNESDKTSTSAAVIHSTPLQLKIHYLLQGFRRLEELMG